MIIIKKLHINYIFITQEFNKLTTEDLLQG